MFPRVIFFFLATSSGYWLVRSLGTNRVIVKFKTNRAGTDQRAKLAQWQVGNEQIVRTYQSIFSGFAIQNLTDDDVAAISFDDDVEYVETDGPIRTPLAHGDEDRSSSVTDAASDSLLNWGLDRIDDAHGGLDGSYDYYNSGYDVNIFIVGTGINRDHVDFNDGRVRDGCFTAYPDGGCTDWVGLGTHVAAIAAGKYSGVAKSSTLISVIVLDQNGAGYISDCLAGLEYILTQGGEGDPYTRPGVVHLGVDFDDFSQSINDAISTLVQSWILVAVHAGDGDGADACSESTASSLDGVVTVASSDISDSRSTFSNVGPCVDLFAPGSNIYSADAFSSNGYVSKSGTSVASAFVAGVAALYLSFLGESPSWIRDVMVDDASEGILSDVQTSPNLLLYSWEAAHLLPPCPPAERCSQRSCLCQWWQILCRIRCWFDE